MNIEGFVLLPGVEHLAGIAGHDARVGCNAVAVKCRLRKPALTQPGFAFVGEQAFAEEPAAFPDYVVLREILIIADENGLDQVRMIEKVNVDPRSAVIEDVTEFGRPL